MSELNPYKQQASKSIQELIQEITLLKLRIADLESQLRWIPVSERLPEKDGVYIITNPPSITLAYWFDNLWRYSPMQPDYKGAFPVTHWRPLPEAPKEVRE